MYRNVYFRLMKQEKEKKGGGSSSVYQVWMDSIPPSWRGHLHTVYIYQIGAPLQVVVVVERDKLGERRWEFLVSPFARTVCSRIRKTEREREREKGPFHIH